MLLKKVFPSSSHSHVQLATKQQCCVGAAKGGAREDRFFFSCFSEILVNARRWTQSKHSKEKHLARQERKKENLAAEDAVLPGMVIRWGRGEREERKLVSLSRPWTLEGVLCRREALVAPPTKQDGEWERDLKIYRGARDYLIFEMWRGNMKIWCWVLLCVFVSGNTTRSVWILRKWLSY